MNTEERSLDDLVRHFAAQWVRLSDPGTDERLLADPILVLGPQGTTSIAREAFLAAVAARAKAVADAQPPTTLTHVTAQALGERMVLATIGWEFRHGTAVVTLMSDFLLQRGADGALQCVAYLPRTNVLDHVPPAS